MTHTDILTRPGLPEDMQLLLSDYPRAAWPDHPNFASSIQNWMGAHQMFRRLGTLTAETLRRYLNRETAPEESAGRLSYFGNLLVRNLHGHHGWEDRSFFPELAEADPRFEHGLDMLETDHEALDDVLDRFTRGGNRVLKLVELDETQARDEAGPLLEVSEEIGRFLNRHLSDEEDLVVPILLHHKLRG